MSSSGKKANTSINFTRKYKIAKNVSGYKPAKMGKRTSLFNSGGKSKHLNTIYALDNYDNDKDEGDKAVIEGKKRYQKLRDTDSSKLSNKDQLEMKTLYYLLKKRGKVEGLKSPTGTTANLNSYNYGPEVITENYSVTGAPAAPAAKAAPAAAKAANTTKKNRSANLGIYKIFKGYTPKTKRSIMHRATNNDKRKNLIWNVSNSSPSEETFTKALARYQELDAKAENMSEKEVAEYTALRYFLSKKQKIHVNTGNAEDIMRLAIYPERVDKLMKLNKANNNPTPLLPSVSRKGSIAGDPTINGTIQRMKCTVCESQSIIDKALKPGEAPRKCDICGAKAVVNDIGNVSNIHNYLNELPNPPIADYKSNTPANAPPPPASLKWIDNTHSQVKLIKKDKTELILGIGDCIEYGPFGNDDYYSIASIHDFNIFVPSDSKYPRTIQCYGYDGTRKDVYPRTFFGDSEFLNTEGRVMPLDLIVKKVQCPKPNGLGNNPLNRVNSNLLGKNVESAFNTDGSLNLEAMANARADELKYEPGSTNLKVPISKDPKPNGLGNNPLNRVNSNLLGQNVESAFNTPGSLNLEAMANARAAANAAAAQAKAKANAGSGALPLINESLRVRVPSRPSSLKAYAAAQAAAATQAPPASAAVPAPVAAAAPKNYKFPEIKGVGTISVTKSNLNNELTSASRYKLGLEQTKVKDYIKKLIYAKNKTQRITNAELDTLTELKKLNKQLNEKLNQGVSTRKNRKNRRNTRTSRR